MMRVQSGHKLDFVLCTSEIRVLDPKTAKSRSHLHLQNTNFVNLSKVVISTASGED